MDYFFSKHRIQIACRYWIFDFQIFHFTVLKTFDLGGVIINHLLRWKKTNVLATTNVSICFTISCKFSNLHPTSSESFPTCITDIYSYQIDRFLSFCLALSLSLSLSLPSLSLFIYTYILMYLPTPPHELDLTEGQYFKVDFNKFGFRIFLLLERLLYQGF